MISPLFLIGIGFGSIVDWPSRIALNQIGPEKVIIFEEDQDYKEQGNPSKH